MKKSPKSVNFEREIDLLFPKLKEGSKNGQENMIDNLSLILTFQKLPIQLSDARTYDMEAAKNDCLNTFFIFAQKLENIVKETNPNAFFDYVDPSSGVLMNSDN